MRIEPRLTGELHGKMIARYSACTRIGWEKVLGVKPRNIRCVLGMVASDKHSKGIRTLARIFRDHGLEVIYLGEHNTARQLAEVAVSEDVDFVGVSFSTGDYVARAGEVVEALVGLGADDIGVLVGGLIHPEDVPTLEGLGVAGVFGPDSTRASILEFIDRTFAPAVSNKPGA
ncbi:cobalamin-dependent protein [Streptomyces sp. NPDC096310]|uniref:cobalamin-dependent protein n=1 Tax=Streptomyces sp. NPDC096310 TaxID=3366082 RepID=UPI003823E86C